MPLHAAALSAGLLSANNRLVELGKIVGKFEEIAAEQRGEVKAMVTTADVRCCCCRLPACCLLLLLLPAAATAACCCCGASQLCLAAAVLLLQCCWGSSWPAGHRTTPAALPGNAALAWGHAQWLPHPAPSLLPRRCSTPAQRLAAPLTPPWLPSLPLFAQGLTQEEMEEIRRGLQPLLKPGQKLTLEEVVSG